MKLKIGTRGSKLAMWQAQHVKSLLVLGGAEVEVVPIETTGDKVLDVSIAKIGSKGVFTEEIEEQLADGRIDIAVHSAKDLQSTLPAGFDLIAIGEREKINDVLLSNNKKIDLRNSSLKIGTSSTRRIAFFKKHYPQITIVPVRGNLQTRIKKMEEGHCDALMLAYAGVSRMGYEDRIAGVLDIKTFIPAVGQGSIAVESFSSLASEKSEFVRKSLNHRESEIAVRAERAYLKKMNGGCSIPIFAYANVVGEKVVLQGGIISLDGTNQVLDTTESSADDPEKSGEELGNKILNQGGAEILAQIRSELS